MEPLHSSLPTLAEGSETESGRTRGDTALSEPSPTVAQKTPAQPAAADGASSSETVEWPLSSPRIDDPQDESIKGAFTQRRTQRVVSVSGGGLHNDMLAQLTALRAVANANSSGNAPLARRPLAQTYQRRPKMSDVRNNRAANIIAHEWRRKQLLRELLSGTDEKKMRDRLNKAEASAQGRGGVVNGPGVLDRATASKMSVTSLASSVSASPRTGGAMAAQGATSNKPAPACEPESPRGEVVGVGVYRKTEPRPASQSPGSTRTKMWRQHSRKAAAGASAPAAAEESLIDDDDFPKPQRMVARDHGRRALATQLEQFGDPNPGALHPLYCDVTVFDRFGTDVSQYFHFMYHSKTFFIFLFVINLSNIIINIEGNTYGFDPFVMHTIGNTAGDGVLAKGGHSYAFMEFLTSGMLLAYLFWIRGEMETIYDRVRGNGQKRKLTAADFTVMVANIPPTWGSDKVREFFEKSFGEVVHVGLSLDYRSLIQAVNQTRRLKDQHNDNLLYLVQVLKLPEADDKERKSKEKRVRKARASVMKSMQALESNDKTIKHLMKQRYRCTGYAFVTFDKLIVAQAVKQAFKRKNKTGLRVLAGGLTVEPAPEPHDVIWENLQCSPREVLIRQVVSCLVMFSLCMLGTSILFLTNAALTWEHAAFSWVKETSVAGFIQGIAIWLLSVLLIVAGHLVLIIAVIVLANTIERPHTHGDKEISVMLKISFFQWFNNFAQSIVFLFLETEKNPDPDGMFSAGWYGSGGALIINALIGDLVVINLLIDGLKPEVMIQRYVLTRWAKTQARMDDMWVIPADITLAFRVQLTNKFLLLGMQYSFAIPVLYALLAAHMWLAHWVDRWNFLHRLSPPPPTHDRQMALVTGFMLPCSVALHLIMAPVFFWHICEKHGLNLDENTPPSPPSPPNVPTISPPNAPPPPSPPGTTCTCDNGILTDMAEAVELWCDPTQQGGAYCMVEQQGWKACGDTQWSSAQLIVWGSSIIWGCVLVWYVYSGSLSQREKRSKERSQGKRMTVLPKRATKMFRFFMQRDVHAPPPRGGLPQGAHILPLSRKPRPGFCGEMLESMSPSRIAAPAAAAAAAPAAAPAAAGRIETRPTVSRTASSDTSEGGSAVEPSPRTPTIAQDPVDGPQAPLSSAAASQRSSNNESESCGDTERGTAKSMCVHTSFSPPGSSSCPALAAPNGCSKCSVCSVCSACSADTSVGIAVSNSSAAPGAAQPPIDHAEASSSSLVEDEGSLLSPMQTFDKPAAHKAVLAAAPSAEDARKMEERLVAQAAAVAASGGADMGNNLGYRVMQHHQDEARRARQGGGGVNPEDVVQLEERTVFYLPPLVVTLLASFCKDATKTRREVNHYLKQHRPLEEAEACGHAAASHMIMRKRSISSFAANLPARVNNFSATMPNLPNLPKFERRDSAATSTTPRGNARPSAGPFSRINSLAGKSSRSKDSRVDLNASQRSFDGSEASSAPTPHLDEADDEADLGSKLPAVLDEVELAMTTLQTPRKVPRTSRKLSDVAEGDGGSASSLDDSQPNVPKLTKEQSDLAEAEDLEREEAIHKLELAAQKLAAEARKAQEQLNQEKDYRRGSAMTASSKEGSSHVEMESSKEGSLSSLSMGNPVI